MKGLLNILDEEQRVEVAKWARRKATQLDSPRPRRGRPGRVALLAQGLCAAYELGYRAHLRHMRQRAVWAFKRAKALHLPVPHRYT